MFVETGQETLVHFQRGGQEYKIAVDDESYARMLNDGYEVIEEIMKFTRLPPELDPNMSPELRSPE